MKCNVNVMKYNVNIRYNNVSTLVINECLMQNNDNVIS